MKEFWLFLVMALVVGCSDVVTSHYGTYNEAANDQLFGRGWLPEFIPLSSFNITTSNNLDLNQSEGEFSFLLPETDSFVSRLVPYYGRGTPFSDFEKLVERRKAEGYALYEFSRKGCVWVFFMNRGKGHTYYRMWLVHNSN